MMELLKEERLERIHPDLVRTVKLAVERAPWPVLVLEGVRTLERQKQLIAQGASQTMNSRHIPTGPDFLGKAVDLAPAPGGKASWAWPLYYQFAPFMKAAAKELKVPLEWGGDWTTFKDGPHWQLPYRSYP